MHCYHAKKRKVSTPPEDKDPSKTLNHIYSKALTVRECNQDMVPRLYNLVTTLCNTLPTKTHFFNTRRRNVLHSSGLRQLSLEQTNR